MPAFVPDYEHDLFVSYAHVDNQERIPGNELSAWVATFADQLKIVLGQKLGRADWGDSWRDPRLRGNEPITPEIEHAVRNSAILVAVLSEGYLESEWCQRELDLFLESRGGPEGANGRLFVVALSEIDRARWPDVFGDLLGYKFFAKEDGRARTLAVPVLDPKEQLYFTRLDDLSTDLADRLKKLKEGPDSASPSVVAGTERKSCDGCVFLAEVTPDLELQRDDVKRHLTHVSIRVLPERYYIRTPAAYRQAMEQDLKQANLFVQMLGPYSGPATEELPSGYEGLQLELAKVANIPILRCRDTEIDPNTKIDARRQDELNAGDVEAMDIESLKTAIEKKVRSSLIPPPVSTTDGKSFVLINADDTDRKVTHPIIDRLEKDDIRFDVRPDSSIAEIVEEDQYDALIVVYGACSVTWAEAQVRRCRRVMLKRKRLSPICAVYIGPPDEKERLLCKPPRFYFIDYSKVAEFDRFIDEVKARRAAM